MIEEVELIQDLTPDDYFVSFPQAARVLMVPIDSLPRIIKTGRLIAYDRSIDPDSLERLKAAFFFLRKNHLDEFEAVKQLGGEKRLRELESKGLIEADNRFGIKFYRSIDLFDALQVLIQRNTQKPAAKAKPAKQEPTPKAKETVKAEAQPKPKPKPKPKLKPKLKPKPKSKSVRVSKTGPVYLTVSKHGLPWLFVKSKRKTWIETNLDRVIAGFPSSTQAFIATHLGGCKATDFPDTLIPYRTINNNARGGTIDAEQRSLGGGAKYCYWIPFLEMIWLLDLCCNWVLADSITEKFKASTHTGPTLVLSGLCGDYQYNLGKKLMVERIYLQEDRFHEAKAALAAINPGDLTKIIPKIPDPPKAKPSPVNAAPERLLISTDGIPFDNAKAQAILYIQNNLDRFLSSLPQEPRQFIDNHPGGCRISELASFAPNTTLNRNYKLGVITGEKHFTGKKLFHIWIDYGEMLWIFDLLHNWVKVYRFTEQFEMGYPTACNMVLSNKCGPYQYGFGKDLVVRRDFIESEQFTFKVASFVRSRLASNVQGNKLREHLISSTELAILLQCAHKDIVELIDVYLTSHGKCTPTIHFLHKNDVRSFLEKVAEDTLDIPLHVMADSVLQSSYLDISTPSAEPAVIET